MKIKIETVILGGGVAGLAAARRLIELGMKPLVIEAGTYPAHKVCGEFFSPSSLSILKRWDIDPISIRQVRLHTLTQSLAFNFPSLAGALSHITLDTELALQITQLGATLLTNTKVEKLIPPLHGEGIHRLILSSGEEIFAKHLVVAAGRLSSHSNKTPNIRYAGFKTHFSGIDLNSSLEMFSFPAAYLGLAPIENGRANMACITTIENYKKASSSKQFMQTLIESHPSLNKLVSAGSNLFDTWLEAFIPEFGLRTTPDWPRTYWIGDAAGTIPPASGNGLSLALVSGCLAAEYASRDDPIGFKHAWRKRCASQIFYGKWLHHLMLHPNFGNWAIRAGRVFPSLGAKFFSLSR
jgi:flavin-dependent dehydrogenase